MEPVSAPTVEHAASSYQTRNGNSESITGPAPLPTSILEKGAQAFLNFENSGLSLAEISHRSKTAESILSDTRNALIELLDIPNDYEVLFMHGGGSGEFSE